jgi:phosphatidylglycerol:prolipoprotein diacylglycerol transferase
VHPNLFQFGRIVLPTYGFLVALGTVIALLVCMRTARLLQLDTDKVWNLAIIATLIALAGSRLLSLVSNWPRYGGSATMAIAIAAGWPFARYFKLPLRRTADAFAPAIALASSVAAIGCLEAGCDYGTPTQLPWAVMFRSRAAMPGTPLGVPLHPTQLYASLGDFALFVLLLWLLYRPHRDGDILAAWLFLSGVSAFMLAFLRGDSIWLGGVATASQLVAVFMVLAGAALWWNQGLNHG